VERSSARRRAVVVGGGYAGVMAANRLAGLGPERGVEVVLIDPDAGFTERIRLHRVATGARASARLDWDRVLHPAVVHCRARAVRIDSDASTVELQDGSVLAFDSLVYAVGSGEPVSALDSVATGSAAVRTRERLAALGAGSAVAVVGAGPTGVETAAAIATGRPDLKVRIVARGTAPHAQTGDAAVMRRLRALGITTLAGTVDPFTGQFGDADRADVTIWAAGLGVPRLAADSGLPTDESGRLLVDGTLAVRGHGRIVGAGDAVGVDDPRGRHLRPSCASALPLGAHAADTALAHLDGSPARAIDIGYALQCLDLGDSHGRVRRVRPDDAPTRWTLTGRAGGWAKEQVCRMTVAWLAKEARRPGSYTWPRGPRIDSHAPAEERRP
jgi:NADH:ubiquinone reductase (H+-translocating)